MITNTHFLKVGNHIIVTATSSHSVALNDVLTCKENNSYWLVVGLGRTELGTLKNQVGLTIKNIQGELPKNGSVLLVV